MPLMSRACGEPAKRSRFAIGDQPNFNGSKLAELLIPIGSLTDQRHVSEFINSAFARVDRLANEATSARKLIGHLDQAVLAKAFRGELVPQDPNNEPASVLLDRIKKERGPETTKVSKRKAQG